MIVLDTNVISELMKATPAERVMNWVGGQPLSTLCTTSNTHHVCSEPQLGGPPTV